MLLLLWPTGSIVVVFHVMPSQDFSIEKLIQKLKEAIESNSFEVDLGNGLILKADNDSFTSFQVILGKSKYQFITSLLQHTIYNMICHTLT